MDRLEKQEKIELANTRQEKRPVLLFSEQKLWFWMLITCAAFVSFGSISFYLSGGQGPRAFINAALTGSFASWVVIVIRKDRYLEFKHMRSKRRVERIEKELERFVVVLLRGMRLPLRNLGRAIDTSYQKTMNTRKKAHVSIGASESSPPVTSQPEKETFPWESVREDIHELDSLAQGMLRVARARRAELKKDWVDVNSLVVGVVSQLDVMVQRSGASVQMKTLPSCLGDSHLVRETFQELISRNTVIC